MPNDGQTMVEQLRALIQVALDVLSRSREVIARLDAARPPKPPQSSG
jgi:hypothetical protein